MPKKSGLLSQKLGSKTANSLWDKDLGEVGGSGYEKTQSG